MRSRGHFRQKTQQVQQPAEREQGVSEKLRKDHKVNMEGVKGRGKT